VGHDQELLRDPAWDPHGSAYLRFRAGQTSLLQKIQLEGLAVALARVLESDINSSGPVLRMSFANYCRNDVRMGDRSASRDESLPVKNRLRVLRAEREWSQATLGSRLGVSRQTVNAIETGKYDPSLPLAFKIAQLFERQIEDIFIPD
jgi:putative transcriptional regulator